MDIQRRCCRPINTDKSFRVCCCRRWQAQHLIFSIPSYSGAFVFVFEGTYFLTFQQLVLCLINIFQFVQFQSDDADEDDDYHDVQAVHSKTTRQRHYGRSTTSLPGLAADQELASWRASKEWRDFLLGYLYFIFVLITAKLQLKVSIFLVVFCLQQQ